MSFSRHRILLSMLGLSLFSCSTVETAYDITGGTVKAAYRVTKEVVKLSIGTTKVIYKIGRFTFEVVMAPLTWPLTRDDLESIDGLPPKEAIQKGRVKSSPYVVNGKRYVPMSVAQAAHYREVGTASWYGYETYHKPGGRITANGEAFNPNGLTAAHKHLPLPMFVKVTNLQNRRAIIVRVNDRGPFYGDRIIDLSAGAAKRLGFHQKGTAKVLVEAIELKDGEEAQG
jgi:rare lipoprotein A